ncbi:glucosaminidase domain-containing protein [Hyphomicrobium zavarzinii]|jgi:hypothetical protein|uniref:glucosaminidase domain-containing protein n=1 Tax=Hyphomicrobium zavarzinii TaxID=48292 RepID=UPI000A0526CF|nr:glucosaminidase domain-containing protein [Hyphomicrobium zavarzinii]
MTASFSSLSFVSRSACVVLAAGLAALAAPLAAVAAPKLPEIRTSRQNMVPACVTPERLMAFLTRRNGNLSPRFRDIASFYRHHGETWHVRWDYAFFQMAIETNFLTYRAPNGRMGDVDPKQNNFAGIGTTGGGVPGDSFPDVNTGVLAQIQHLVVYSGEMINNPVAPRTQLKQEHILAKSRELNRPVRFSDLARRWAADPKYAGSIEWVAGQFRSEYCAGGQRAAPQDIEVLPWQQAPAQPRATGGGRAAAPPSQPPERRGGMTTGATSSASSAVRTVWSRGDATAPAAAPMRERAPASSTASAATAPSAKAAVKAAASPSKAPAARTAADAVAELLAEPDGFTTPAAPASPASPADTAESGEPVPGFALFTPPSALADVKVPALKPASHVAQAGNAAPASDVKQAAAPADALAGPPPPPPTTAVVPPIVESVPPPPSTPYVAAAGPEAGGLAALVTGLGGGGDATAKPQFDPPSGLGVKPGRCLVETARYGGETTVLVKSPVGADVHYIALSVIDGFEDSMTKSFLSSRPAGGEAIGTFPSRNEALAKAHSLCAS